MSFQSCFKLRSIPPLKLTFLKELDLSYCTSLESFPLAVDKFLGKLKILRLEHFHNLKSIPPLKWDVLEELDLSNCYMLESLLLSVGKILGKVKTLRLVGCHNIKNIPPLKLDSLETLDLSDCTSLESFSVGVGESLLKLKTLDACNCYNLRSIPPLKLDSLKAVNLSHCHSLESFPSAGDGLLENIEFLNINQCIILKSIPPLRLTSLETLNMSHCLSLDSFPEILGDMRNIKDLHLDNIPKNLLPLPLKNLSPRPCDCVGRNLHLDFSPCACDCGRNFAEVSMLAESTTEGEGNTSPMKSSHVGCICLYDCKLSDEYWSISFMLFANVKELHLANNKFTVLPKSMEKCNFLWRLVLDDCVELQEIKGIPPCLKVLSALNCQLLTSSSKSKLLNQKLHEAQNTWFCFPGAEIPEWFDHKYSAESSPEWFDLQYSAESSPEWFDHQCSAESSICFWFRNKFPAIVLGVVSKWSWDDTHSPDYRVRVIINGNAFFYSHGFQLEWGFPYFIDHLHLFHMQMKNFNDNIDKALLENKWNHVEVDFGLPEIKASGFHVLKDKSSMEDIQFTNPEIE